MSKKLITLVFFVILTVSMGASMKFQLSVDTMTDSTHYKTQHRGNVSVQRINTTLFNSGSIGCQYRLKGEFSYRNNTYTRYSAPYSMFPGAQDLAELYFVPENYTGEVTTDVYVDYCDQQENITSFNYTVPEKVVVNKTVKSQTLEVGDKESLTELEVESGWLVPKETPPYWKAGTARINNSRAELSYEPPIFKSGENLTYTVLNEDLQPVGQTEVWLREPEDSLADKIIENAVYIVLGVSALFNLLLLASRLRKHKK